MAKETKIHLRLHDTAVAASLESAALVMGEPPSRLAENLLRESLEALGFYTPVTPITLKPGEKEELV